MTQPATPSTPISTANDPLGYGFAVAGAVLFSTKGIFIKLAYADGVSTEMLLSLHTLVAAPVYLAIMVKLLRRENNVRHLKMPIVLSSIAVGILGYYIASYLNFLGLNFLTAQYERLMLFTYPFFVLLFGVWFFGDHIVDASS
ncbi:MAG: DMT family transporter [Candidatus Devosia symbiotica]|nr:DMT family transporter [Candidatus Devosia symbiotica]